MIFEQAVLHSKIWADYIHQHLSESRPVDMCAAKTSYKFQILPVLLPSFRDLRQIVGPPFSDSQKGITYVLGRRPKLTR